MELAEVVARAISSKSDWSTDEMSDELVRLVNRTFHWLRETQLEVGNSEERTDAWLKVVKEDFAKKLAR